MLRRFVAAVIRLLIVGALAWALFHAGWVAGALAGYRAGVDDTCPNAADDLQGTTEV